MRTIEDSPLLVLVLSLVMLWSSVQIGAFLRKKLGPLGDDERRDFDLVLTSTLALLGLIIGFSFSMVFSRYDQRKNYEEAEANAIGTEYVRADLLPPADASRLRQLLTSYLNERVLFYQTRDVEHLRQIDSETLQLQTELWSVVEAVAAMQPTPTVALAVSGMNDVLNSQGYTQAAWWNRFPTSAWTLSGAIAILCNLLVGYGSRRTSGVVLVILPLAVSISFFLIADMSSPREGLIRVAPQNLVRLSESLQAR